MLFYIFLYYPNYIIIKAFASTALMFTCMILPQSIAKNDLSIMSKVVFMLILGLGTSVFVNVLTPSTQVDYIASFLGVFIFAVLTAYGTKVILETSSSLKADSSEIEYQMMSAFAAMLLYIKFIFLCLVAIAIVFIFIGTFLNAMSKNRRRRPRRRKSFI